MRVDCLNFQNLSSGGNDNGSIITNSAQILTDFDPK